MHARVYRHTKIIATVGPATESPERLAKLIIAGLDVIRLNMAHGTGEWVAAVVKRIREVSAEVQRHVAVMMDVKGPEIRTGVVAEPIELGRATRSSSTPTGPAPAGIRGVDVNYPGLARRRRVGATVLSTAG